MDQDSGRKSKTSPKVRHICHEFEKQPSNVACILSFFHVDVEQCTYLLMYVSVCCMRYTQGQAKSSYQAKREPLCLFVALFFWRRDVDSSVISRPLQQKWSFLASF